MEYRFWSTPAYSCWSLQCLPTSSAKGYKNQNQSKAVNTETFFAFKKKKQQQTTCNILQLRKSLQFPINILIVTNHPESISL